MENEPTMSEALTPVTAPKQPIPQLWLVAGIAILIGLVGLFIASKLLNAPKPLVQEIVETPTSTPTPIRLRASIATQSAFMALTESHASVAAGLAGTNLDDPSLSPPVLDLPLGFRP